MYNLIVEYFEYYKLSVILSGSILLTLIVLIDYRAIKPGYDNIRELGFHAAEIDLRQKLYKLSMKLSFIPPIIAMVLIRLSISTIIWISFMPLAWLIIAPLLQSYLDKLVYRK